MDPLETLKKFEKNLKAEKRGRGKCHSAKKNWKWRPFCFGMVLYFMLEALDALKISTYGKSEFTKSGTYRVNFGLTKKN